MTLYAGVLCIRSANEALNSFHSLLKFDDKTLHHIHVFNTLVGSTTVVHLRERYKNVAASYCKRI